MPYNASDVWKMVPPRNRAMSLSSSSRSILIFRRAFPNSVSMGRHSFHSIIYHKLYRMSTITDRKSILFCCFPLKVDPGIITLPWGNEDTQQLIDILGKYDIKATFFVVGEWVDKYPESQSRESTSH